tara:strand:+ start:835 stop:1347 length:513 start_codon:yes stop_codon:yes gene_type:complete
VDYIIFDYPFPSELNLNLYKIVHQYYSNDVKGGASITSMDLHRRGIKEIDILIGWIGSLLPDVCYFFSQDGEDSGDSPPYNLNSFSIVDCWGIHYNKGEYVVKHNHFPYSLSFCYYVRTPDGSSPFILQEERIEMNEGQIIFFPSYQYHSCEQSKVDGRCAVVGNILYTP